MKRKTTNLEQRLINDGWCLSLKRYTGKHSQKTFCYEYSKNIDDQEHIIVLNPKRTNVVKFGIANVHIDFVSKETLANIHQLYLELKEFVETLKTPEPREDLLESDE